MLRALFSSKEQQLIKGVHIYFSKKGVLVAALHQNHSGIMFEQMGVAKFDGRPTAEQLGLAFKDAFDRFSVKDTNLNGAKKSEWPAFQASKLGSLKNFESSYRLMSCTSLNASNSVVRAAMSHPAEKSVEVALTFNPLLQPSAVGEQLLKLAQVAEVM